MQNRKIFILCAALVVFGLALLFMPSSRPHFGNAGLSITRADGKHFDFKVETAITLDQQAYGLMFVKSMPADHGMIFPYKPPREVAFWMRNTLIPLDMLFVGSGGAITHIVTNAVPEDPTPIPSQGPVAAVIELNGGTVAADGFAIGDKVESSALSLMQQ